MRETRWGSIAGVSFVVGLEEAAGTRAGVAAGIGFCCSEEAAWLDIPVAASLALFDAEWASEVAGASLGETLVSSRLSDDSDMAAIHWLIKSFNIAKVD
jgi:hypothetical protein